MYYIFFFSCMKILAIWTVVIPIENDGGGGGENKISSFLTSIRYGRVVKGLKQYKPCVCKSRECIFFFFFG